MSPDFVARVLAGDEAIFGFEGLQAYSLENGVVRLIPAAWWQNFCVRELQALTERLESTQAGRETQHEQWRDKSLASLPARAFVWKDEYTALHKSNWEARLRSKEHSVWFLNRPESQTEEADGDEGTFQQRVAIKRVRQEFEAWRELDFSPFIPTRSRELLVMMVRQDLTATPCPAPLVAVSASDGVEPDKTGPVVPAPAQGNSTKTPRKDSIDPVIALAQTMCRDPKDTNQVWPQMQVLAESEQAPFLASTTKGLKYHKNGKDAYLTRDALDKRLHPEKRKPPAARR